LVEDGLYDKLGVVKKFHLNKRIMTREIEFRGKRLDNGEWLYGDLMHDNQGGCYIYPLDGLGLFVENKVDPDTVGQFTGLVDKNGVKIYEGDIVEVYDFTSVYASKYRGVVKRSIVVRGVLNTRIQYLTQSSIRCSSLMILQVERRKLLAIFMITKSC